MKCILRRDTLVFLSDVNVNDFWGYRGILNGKMLQNVRRNGKEAEKIGRKKSERASERVRKEKQFNSIFLTSQNVLVCQCMHCMTVFTMYMVINWIGINALCTYEQFQRSE